VVESVRDVASGLSLSRPGIDRVRRILRDGAADILLAYAVDRIARDSRKLAELVNEVEEIGARLEFVTESFEDPTRRALVLSIRAFASDVEREKSQSRSDGVGRCV
jgi:site-specific DNA recombinase